MSNELLSFSIRDLITDQNHYCIPMYQRNYAWGEGEIHQLIQDIKDFGLGQSNRRKKPYYIGTLVVFNRTDGSFEVIDGQQRFTTLTLLAICLKRLAVAGKITVTMNWFQKPNLSFENRRSSTYTLNRLMQGVELNDLHNEDCNLDLLIGYQLLENHLISLNTQLNDFCQYLFEKVQITRVPVPHDTDLNHYFEVMNSRGEQLEKHEIVKARLMSVLHTIEDKKERDTSLKTLAKVWNAVANMERYVQYGFTPDERHQVFGWKDWGQFKPSDFTELCKLLKAGSDSNKDTESTSQSKNLSTILTTLPIQLEKQNSGELTPERFNSVINFSNFLLHVLRIWTGRDIPLDDKQLIKQFDDNVCLSAQAVQDFVFALIKTKYLFDQFIIKREFSDRGENWSLKRLHYYSPTSQSYINSFEQDSEGGFRGINRRILQLLCAFHVSTPTQIYKHWLNGALNILYNMKQVTASTYLQLLEHLARQFVYGRFLNPFGSSEYYQMVFQGSGYPDLDIKNPELLKHLKYGGIENNLVFNYLDYLIWLETIEEDRNTDEVIQRFEFTFRSSVEHFSPQKPMDGYTPLPDKVLHSFGNLCLISHNKNSRLSNFQPNQKRGYFQSAINDKRIDSLKLYKMIQLMDNMDGTWGKTQIEAHEQQMLKLLEDDSKQETQL
ncbi:TPA: DUF262 domain-containing HNH endonuclease family protein [Proteus mirabilis]|uniref:DUF262 domain-containing protein n=1 Tax=Proteus mirabilis TaxID=584 RepID=UPI001A2BFD01|nr:DUF262 domain-containing HNH endonuclease family protein [Proteus mirabilis]ELT0936706.1 DUF262 domain-containing protein [Proteus mirabilis]MCW9720967.1 DUF262 domain-containing HNH endonuclease family protein [Proteus mirabilis]MDF7290618.1 DUF262 domain-containing HNH endonuclease family protein [Proteus mirabilis]HAU5560099.1 DUF262 domain-containing protein [Proteus mirabilis]